METAESVEISNKIAPELCLLNCPEHPPIEADVAAVDDVHSLVEQQPDFAAHFLVEHTVGVEGTGVRVSV